VAKNKIRSRKEYQHGGGQCIGSRGQWGSGSGLRGRELPNLLKKWEGSRRNPEKRSNERVKERAGGQRAGESKPQSREGAEKEWKLERSFVPISRRCLSSMKVT